MTVEVQQPMDNVTGKFFVKPLAELRRLARCGGHADDHFTVRKGNHVGRTGNVHEPPVHAGNDAVAHQRDFHCLQLRKHGFLPSGTAEAQRQGHFSHALKKR